LNYDDERRAPSFDVSVHRRRQERRERMAELIIVASSASMAAFIASRQVRREGTTEIIIAVKIFSGRSLTIGRGADLGLSPPRAIAFIIGSVGKLVILRPAPS
jgi:hypothetical protein